MLMIIDLIIIIQLNLYYFCAEPTAAKPITGTAQSGYG
jgi:hypothetical protein